MPDIASLSAAQSPTFSVDDDAIDDLLYLARTNALIDLKAELETHGSRHLTTSAQILQSVRDPYTGNGIAHHAAANGHISILDYVRAIEADERLAADGTASDSVATPRSLFSSINEQGSTPLHYAAVNGQLQAVEVLLSHPDWAEKKGRRRAYVEMRNDAGRTARDEADHQGSGGEAWLKVVGLLEKQEHEEETSTTEESSELVEEDADAALEEDIENSREGVGGMGMSER